MTQPTEIDTRPVWTIDAINALPAVIGVDLATQILGLGRSTGRRLLREGAYPVPGVVRWGSQWRVPTSQIRAVLGLDDQAAPTEPQATAEAARLALRRAAAEAELREVQQAERALLGKSTTAVSA